MEEKNFRYAGFWKRFVAYFIDEIIIDIVETILILPVFLIFGLSFFASSAGDKWDEFSSIINVQFNNNDEMSIVYTTALIGVLIIIGIVAIVIKWLYFALMESSKKQATLGKMAMGIIVTDLEGNRISFGKATGRFFGKIISGLILYIGFIMAGFTEKKQALHDMLANCLVIMNDQH